MAAAPSARLNAGMPTSSIPSPTPAGNDVKTRVRTPGDLSAPSSPRAGCSSSLSTWRVGGSAVKIAVPTTTATAETISAPAGEVTAAITAVSSGPEMKISSIIVLSSA